MGNPIQPRKLVLDPETEAHEGSGLTGPRIRCPKCEWTPGRGDEWGCTCGHQWHTFDTGGVCPQCMQQWAETQCLSCLAWSAHSDWYEY